MTRCKVCRTEFQRRSITHKACSPECAEILARRTRLADEQKAARIERRKDAIARQALKPRSKLSQETQDACNKYVRLRDAHLGCVSCDKPPNWAGQWHAGHWLSRGSRPDLRFDTCNIFKQCSQDNVYGDTETTHRFDDEVLRRVGQAEVDRLKGPPTAAKLTRDELIALKAEFVAKAKALRES